MLRLALSGSLTILLFATALVEAESPSPSPSPAAGPSSPAPPAPTVDTLDAADLQQAIPIIKGNYVDPAAFSEAGMNRATLTGLLSRLGRGVMLLPARSATATPPPPPFYREIIGGHIGYLRPGDLSRAQLPEFETTLRGVAGKKVDAIVLDLRDSAETSDYGTAAEFANRFVPKNVPLFVLRGPAAKTVRAFVTNQDPVYTGLLVLLVDNETAGAAEVLAAALRSCVKAIIIGQTTAGRAVDYTDLPLPSGKILRVAVAEAIPSDQRPCFPEGVQPDLPVALPAADKHQIFQQSRTKGMAPFVFESDRPHLNEAALLAGTNPEIEAVQATQQQRARGADNPALHDAVLQRAVDLVTSIGVYEKQPGRSP